MNNLCPSCGFPPPIAKTWQQIEAEKVIKRDLNRPKAPNPPIKEGLSGISKERRARAIKAFSPTKYKLFKLWLIRKLS